MYRQFRPGSRRVHHYGARTIARRTSTGATTFQRALGTIAARCGSTSTSAKAASASRREADAWIAAGPRDRQRRARRARHAGEGGRCGARRRAAAAGAPGSGIYIALNKPRGITCTTERDVPGNIVDFVGHRERIFPIGRLDKDSEGLILLTNDGDIVNEVLRVEHGHEKEYLVTVEPPVTDNFLSMMAPGVRIGGEKTKPCTVTRTGPTSSASC